jgi:hypothetical protein
MTGPVILTANTNFCDIMGTLELQDLSDCHQFLEQCPGIENYMQFRDYQTNPDVRKYDAELQERANYLRKNNTSSNGINKH